MFQASLWAECLSLPVRPSFLEHALRSSAHQEDTSFHQSISSGDAWHWEECPSPHIHPQTLLPWILWWPTTDDLQKCSQFQRSPILECLQKQTLYKVEVGPRRAAGKKPGASGSLLARTKVTNDSRWREGWPLSSGPPRTHSFLQGSRSQSWLHTSVTWGGGGAARRMLTPEPPAQRPRGEDSGARCIQKSSQGNLSSIQDWEPLM